MKSNEFHRIVLDELQAVKSDLASIRQTDIPSIKEDLTTFKIATNEAIHDLENRTRWSTRLYTIIGGAIAVALAKFTGSAH